MDPFDPEHLQRQAAVIREQQLAERHRLIRGGAIALVILIVAGVAIWLLTGGSGGSSGASKSAATSTTAEVRRTRPSGSSTSTDAEIATYKAAPLLQPTQIPVGWKSLGAQVIPRSRSVSGCNEVLVRYGTGPDADVNYLDVYLFPATCASHRPVDARDVTIGTNPGWVSDTDPTLSVLAEVDVGRTKVQAETDLDTADALSVLAKLSKLDLENPPPGLLPVQVPSNSGNSSTAPPVATTPTETTVPVETTMPVVIQTTAPGQNRPPAT